MSTNPAIDVEPADAPALVSRAQALAEQTGLALVDQDIGPAPRRAQADLVLMVTTDRLELRALRPGSPAIDGRAVWMDLAKLDTSSGPGRSLGNPLLKAVGIRKGVSHRPHVLDATAGYGEDTWLLAAAGCRVTAVERNPVLFALLGDALARAGSNQPQIARRITTHHADCRALLGGANGVQVSASTPAWDVIYLDPMFPAKRKAAERKPMRLARRLVGEDGDGSSLLEAALETAAQRVVVKRPRRGQPLGGFTPLASHHGKALRFDVYKPPVDVRTVD